MSNRHHEEECLGGAHDHQQPFGRRVGHGPGDVLENKLLDGNSELRLVPRYEDQPGNVTVGDKVFSHMLKATMQGQVRASDPKHAQKMDGGKIPIFQGCFAYFPRALFGVALVSEYGKRKYAPDAPVFNTGWAEVPQGDLRYADAEARHMLKAVCGETGLYDDESDIAHALMEAWNALAKAERLLREGKIELRVGNVIVDGKPVAHTSKKVVL